MAIIDTFQSLLKPGGFPVAPPEETNDLALIFGQSNTGYALVSEMTSGQAGTYNVVNPLCQIYNYGDAMTSFASLSPGINTQLFAGSEGSFGPEVSLYQRFAQQDAKVRHLVKVGVNGTALGDYWKIGKPGEVLYKNRLKQAIISANPSVPFTLKYVVWIQGENDTFNAAFADEYFTNLSNLMADLRYWWNVSYLPVRGGKVDNFKLVVTQMGATNFATAYRAKVRLAEEEFCNNPLNNAVLVNTNSYTYRDIWHYDATSQLQHGIDIFNIVKDL